MHPGERLAGTGQVVLVAHRGRHDVGEVVDHAERANATARCRSQLSTPSVSG